MDKVGEHGKGESVWLAFFLYNILDQFQAVAEIKSDAAFVEQLKLEAATLRTNINTQAWDGEWYKRAYFDDGTPLGSSVNDECKIDSIAQSWSVLSGAGEPEKTKMAMVSADKYLVNKDAGIIQLFDPPFDKSTLNPGYIKGYVPGVRENGGQYTHAAIWLVMAYAAMGNTEKAWELIQLINPINHGGDADSIKAYKVEPYVIAADVYGVPQHKGKGGWTWYTGSAGWMYQLILESFLGLHKKSDKLFFKPNVPQAWTEFSINYRYRQTQYQINFKKTGSGQIKIESDGNQMNDFVQLVYDGASHTATVQY
jgi:cellobiose phosphorylase